MSPKDLFTKYFPRRKKQKDTEKSKPTPDEPIPRRAYTAPAHIQKTPANKAGSAGPPWGRYHAPPTTDGGNYPVGNMYGGVSDDTVGNSHSHEHRDRGHWGWGGVEDGSGSDSHGYGGHGDHGGSSSGGGCSSDSGGGSGGGDSGGSSGGGDGGGGGGGGGGGD
ncbi:uncharacterized protein BKA55DRAFT_533568 [Fusarium redolens]|uniref:Uncharacterized protein n=1 Tax=Fusarium redolens TaxID=48865 RepID=A0A9P9KQQ2_FUSRE|nr:uncharacterized protein BKA55DRAFT_533568 [Fusarium redolens]KAH7266762.1 hypothetical protein BKA55DRAFT_533568 [Fusarium redolens]